MDWIASQCIGLSYAQRTCWACIQHGNVRQQKTQLPPFRYTHPLSGSFELNRKSHRPEEKPVSLYVCPVCTRPVSFVILELGIGFIRAAQELVDVFICIRDDASNVKVFNPYLVLLPPSASRTNLHRRAPPPTRIITSAYTVVPGLI